MFDTFVRLYVDLSSVFDEWFASTIGTLSSLFYSHNAQVPGYYSINLLIIQDSLIA